MAGCAAAMPGEVEWLVVNDCDHAFRSDGLATALPKMAASTAGFLCHFHSNSPAYSYAAYDAEGTLIRPVEKQPISNLAIAGAYGFRDRLTFLDHARSYAAHCPYPELFMSGVYNTMVAAGSVIRGALLDDHLSFGTPGEYRSALTRIGDFQSWHAPAGRG